MVRWFRILLIVITIVLLPFFSLACLTVLNAVNPMTLAFLTSFTIENNSGQDIWVSPIGVVGEDGNRFPLPFSHFKFLHVMASKDTEFLVAKDATRTFVYDWDDIQFSEIVIRSEEGNMRVVVVDANPTQNQYRNLKQTSFTIPSLSELPVAPQCLKDALMSQKANRQFYALSAIGFVSPVLGIILWRTRKKSK